MLDEQRHLAAGGIMTRLLGAKKEVSSCYTGCLHSQHHVGPTPEPAFTSCFTDSWNLLTGEPVSLLNVYDVRTGGKHSCVKLS